MLYLAVVTGACPARRSQSAQLRQTARITHPRKSLRRSRLRASVQAETSLLLLSPAWSIRRPGNIWPKYAAAFAHPRGRALSRPRKSQTSIFLNVQRRLQLQIWHSGAQAGTLRRKRLGGMPLRLLLAVLLSDGLCCPISAHLRDCCVKGFVMRPHSCTTPTLVRTPGTRHTSHKMTHHDSLSQVHSQGTRSSSQHTLRAAPSTAWTETQHSAPERCAR